MEQADKPQAIREAITIPTAYCNCCVSRRKGRGLVCLPKGGPQSELRRKLAKQVHNAPATVKETINVGTEPVFPSFIQS